MVIDSPRIGATTKEQKAFVAKANDSDLIVWAIAAAKADGDIDLIAISCIRKYFAGRPHRRQPPILVALTHVDKLVQRMPGPHGDIDASDPAVVEMVRVVAEGLGIPKNDVVPVSLAPDRAPYNIDQLAGRIAARVPEARQAQLLRLMEDAAPRWSVRRLLGQTGNVAWSAAKTVTPTKLFKR